VIVAIIVVDDASLQSRAVEIAVDGCEQALRVHVHSVFVDPRHQLRVIESHEPLAESHVRNSVLRHQRVERVDRQAQRVRSVLVAKQYHAEPGGLGELVDISLLIGPRL
jgi:hypothetical protein